MARLNASISNACGLLGMPSGPTEAQRHSIFGRAGSVQPNMWLDPAQARPQDEEGYARGGPLGWAQPRFPAH